MTGGRQDIHGTVVSDAEVASDLGFISVEDFRLFMAVDGPVGRCSDPYCWRPAFWPDLRKPCKYCGSPIKLDERIRKMKPGDRVGALLNSDKDKVYLFGYGVYEGDFPTGLDPNPAGWVAETIHEKGAPNPRIRLDDGKIVWGCECWWGSEEEVRNSIGKREIVLVDIETERQKCKTD